MEINVNELSGAALDWAVGMAIGKPLVIRSPIGQPNSHRVVWEQVGDHGGVVWFAPSSNWAQGGPLRDTYGVALWDVTGGNVAATIRGESADFWIDETELDADAVGPTALIALCRAIVAANIGSVVNVPDELL